MKLRSLAAFAALAAACSLAACNGGSNSTGFANLTGQSAQLRFVNASPTLPTVDVYFTSSGTTISSSPTVKSLAYGNISDFTTQTAAAATLTLRASNGTSTVPALPCSFSSPANNGLYTIVFAGTGASGSPYSCLIYHDIGFTGNGQVRLHHASYNAANAGLTTVALGTVANGAGPGASAQQVANATGAIATNGTPDVPGFAVPSSGPLTLAVGPVAATFTSTTTYAATNLVAPGTQTPSNAAGTIPSGVYNNASLFAIDCTGATTPQGSPCANGVGLIGSFDSK